jgi:hypothetical protein
MTEHLSGSAIGSEVTAYCSKCKRDTLHRVDRVAVGSRAGKPGPCLEHDAPWMTREQYARDLKANHDWKQRKLFP